MRERIDYVVLISLLTLSSFIALFMLRAVDDNRLTSWLWVFVSVDAGRVYLLLITGVILAFVLSRVSLPHRCRVPILFALSFSAAAVFWVQPEVIVDAARYFTQAKHLEIYGVGYFFREWGKDVSAWTDLPLIPFLYGMIFRVFGETRLYIQIFTSLLFALTVVLTYRIGKALWNEDIGLIGGVLLLGIPYIFTQIPLMLVDVPTMFFLTLLVFSFTQAMFGGGATMVALSIVSLVLAFFSKYSTWPMLSILVVIFLVRRTLNGELGAQGLAYRGACILAAASLMIGAVVFSKREVFSEQMRLLMTYQEPGLRRWGESFFSTFFFQMHPFVTLSALYSAWVAYRKKDAKYLIISWALVLVMVFQVKRIRYLLPIFPMLALMASYGLQQISDSVAKKFAVLCILFSSLVTAIFAYLPFTQSMSAMNLKEAGEFLNTIDERNVEVFTLPQRKAMMNPLVAVPILDLFTRKQLIYRYDVTNPYPQDEISRSSLRFTWEYRNPQYYRSNTSGRDAAVAVIAADGGEPLPEPVAERIRGYHVVKCFDAHDGIFEYQTMVTIYRSESRTGTERIVQ